MNLSVVLLAVGTWLGGVVSWIVAAAFDFSAHRARYEKERNWLAGKGEASALEKDAIGDLDEAAANRAGGHPDRIESFALTHSQPLLVTLITAAMGFITGFLAAGNGRSTTTFGVAVLLWLALVAAVRYVCIGDAHELQIKLRARRVSVGALWLAALIVFFVFAYAVAGEASTSEPEQVLVPPPKTSA